MKLAVVKPGRSRKGKPSAFVAFWAASADRKEKGPASLPASVRAAAVPAAPAEPAREGACFTAPLGSAGEAERLYVFGAGKSLTISPAKARKILRAAVKTLRKNGETSALLDFPFTLERMSAAEARAFVLRSLAATAYAFTAYKTKPSEEPAVARVDVRLGSGPFADVSEKDAERERKEADAIASVADLVRDLGNTPPNDMPPRAVAERAKKEVRARKRKSLTVRVLDEKAIRKERMGGVLAVGQGSAERPRVVVVEHRGGKKGDAPIALVGKGVTFDSGGISIKPADRMGEMKWDMLGAATALGVVLAASDLDLPVNLVGILALVENLPSGTAYRPGDIVRFRNGKTAEIDNTDAEGRVILGDALDYARDWKPAVLLDYATLTGAALIALGVEAAIVFSDDDALASALVSAGERTDERLWRLPMWDDYRENIRSEWADFKNSGGRPGGAINGAMFLKEFVDPKTPWAHLDIAPTAYYDREHAGHAVGASAFGLALTLRWLKDRGASS